jgi:hypothetical protein
MDFVTTMVDRFGGRALDVPISFRYMSVNYPITSITEERLTYRLSDRTDDYLSIRAHKGIFEITGILLNGSHLVGRTVLFQIKA